MRRPTSRASARCATTGSRAAWSRPAPRPARPSRSSSARSTSCTGGGAGGGAALHSQGVAEARLYGRDEEVYGGLNAFFLLMDEPEVYRLPNTANAVLPGRNNLPSWLTGAVTAVLGLLGGLIALRRRDVSHQQPRSTAEEVEG